MKHEKKNSDTCFDVTIGSYDGAEVCELVDTVVLSTFANSIPKENSGLYRDDGLTLMRNKNGQKTDRIRKDVIKIFKEIGFKIKIKINLKVVNCLDITFNLSNGTYKPYRKPNNNLLSLMPPPTICPKLLSSYQHQQTKAFPNIHQV